jgi:3,4-dihydroxy 2-butanone 4-phosphate synthase
VVLVVFFFETANSLCIIAANKFVIVMDNEDRENEGDLIIAAEKITTEQMAFLIRYSRLVQVIMKERGCVCM